MALNRLIERYRESRRNQTEEQRLHYRQLASEGQSPKVMCIACSDSRTDPAIITRAEPGEIFIVRNVANLVPPWHADSMLHGTSAALEFGVKHLKVESIVIMGHAHCGGIDALADGADKGWIETEFIGPWMRIAASARDQIARDYGHEDRAQQHRRLEKASIVLGLANLMTFPWIREAVEAGRLNLHGWFFSIADGGLTRYDRSSGEFVPLE